MQVDKTTPLSAPHTVISTSTTVSPPTTTPASNSATVTTVNSAAGEISVANHVRLPSFWKQSPTQWFVHADAMFTNKRIRSDLTRVNHVLEALDEDGVRTVMDLLGVDTSYDAVRQRLISTYTIPQATRLQRIIQPGGMGDRTPSRLLRDMREVYPDYTMNSTLEALWLNKLPPAVRTVIAGLTGTTDFLAERADRVWEACADPELLAVARACDQDAPREVAPVLVQQTDARLAALEQAIHALTAQVASLATSQAAASTRAPTDHVPRQQRDRSRSQSQPRPGNPKSGWCYYHDRYGAEARKCRDPCTHPPATRKNP